MPILKVLRTGGNFLVRLHTHVCLLKLKLTWLFLPWLHAGSTEGKHRRMLVTGMSGTGKTDWLLFLMWLLAKQDRTVVLQVFPGEFSVVNSSVDEGVAACTLSICSEHPVHRESSVGGI